MALTQRFPSAHTAPQLDGADPEFPALDYDVVIVGAGIVGLTLACALHTSGLRIAMVEARPKAEAYRSRRAYAITLLSGRIFQGLGVWDDILPHITTFKTIRLAEEFCPDVVNLSPQDLGTAELGYVAEHHVLVAALHRKLERANIDWICPAEVTQVDYGPARATAGMASRATVSLAIASPTPDTPPTLRQITTQLVVAADGARSPIRQQAGITTHGWAYWQSCITAVLRSEKPHQNIAREHFWASGPFATLPLPDNRCQIVLTAPHQEADHWLNAPEEEFLAELNRRYQGQLGQLTLLSDRQRFPVRLMHSDRYVRHRLALVGDAAHCCHPVGGQGLNLGIRDGAALAQVLIRAARQRQDLGSLRVLKRYERWRRLETLAILAFTDLLDRLFSNRWMGVTTLRRLGLWLMKRVRPLKHISLRLMTGLSGQLPDLAKR